MVRDYYKLAEKDQIDIVTMAQANSSYLHYATNIPQCSDPKNCKLCIESARLAVQHYRPIVEKRVVESLMNLYNVRCSMPHPGDD